MIDFFYAKTNPVKTLFEHMLDSGCVATALLTTNNFKPTFNYLYDNCDYDGKNRDNFLDFLSFIISTHDIGKCHVQFQYKLEGLEDKITNGLETEGFAKRIELYKRYSDKPFRHEVYGEQLILAIFDEIVDYAKPWSLIVRMHHHKLHSDDKHNPIFDESGKDISDEKKYEVFARQKKWQKEILHELLKTFNIEYLPSTLKTANASAWWIVLSGLMMLCDWVASSEDYVFDCELSDYKTESIKKARELLYTYGLDSMNDLRNYDCFENVFSIPETSMRDIQKACDSSIPDTANAVIIEAATGEGKTEAAFAAALRICKKQGKTGLYVALPTAATSNQMYKRSKKILNGNDIKLLHSSAWLLDDNVAFASALTSAMEWMSSTKRGLLCQNSVGTVDQCMAAVLRIKYGMLKMLGLLNKVVIIDELHAYDAYMSRIIRKMLIWFKELNIPVIMLSATLPDKTKKMYLNVFSGEEFVPTDAYPLITYVEADHIKEVICTSFKKEVLHIEIEKALGDYEFYAKKAIELVQEVGYVACVCDTVKGAQTTYEILKTMADPSIPIYLLHSRFTEKDRKQIEDKLNKKFSKEGISERPGKCILVATQIVEQSLDFDFDTMITEIAPIDLILQRAGRVKRFDTLVKRSECFKEKKIFVMVPCNDDYKTLVAIYYEILLLRTQNELEKRSHIKIPEDVRGLINSVYNDVLDTDHLDDWSKMYSNERLESLYADANALPEPEADYVFFDVGSPVDSFCKTDEDEAGKSRIATTSTKIIFLDNEDVLDEAKYNFELAKEIHKEAVSVPYDVERITPEPKQGEGYLKGLYAVVSNNKRFSVNKKNFEYSQEYGLIEI